MAFRHPSAGHYTFDTQNGADADAFLYTDPVATDATLPQAAGTARRWCHDTNDTTSTDVGPTSGEGGSPDGYLYTEASSPGAANDNFYLELDQTLNAAIHDIVVEFSTNQRGDTNDATCQVQTNENGAGWVNRGTQFGGSGDPNKVATAGTQIWAQRSVDLTGLISHASTRIRIRITFPSAGTIWHNDYGLDRIAFIGTDQLTQDQDGFRFYDDDGSESAATALAAEDTNISRGKNTNTRLRVQTDNTGDAPTQQATLQYNKVGDSDWRDVPLT